MRVVQEQDDETSSPAQKDEERLLSAQADPFTGVKGKENVGLFRSE
jgi:hypothetical protein